MLTLFGRQGRKTELEVSAADRFPAFEKTTREATESGAQPEQRRVGELYEQPQDAQTKPRKPVTGMQEGECEFALRQDKTTFLKSVEVAPDRRYAVLFL